MANIGPFELVIVLVVALLVLGPKRLPGVGRSLGAGLREFKDSISGHEAHDGHRQETGELEEPEAANDEATGSVRAPAAH